MIIIFRYKSGLFPYQTTPNFFSSKIFCFNKTAQIILTKQNGIFWWFCSICWIMIIIKMIRREFIQFKLYVLKNVFVQQIMFILILSLILDVSSYNCSYGCEQDNCILDNVCMLCKNGFQQDTSCTDCKGFNFSESISETNPLYVKLSQSCTKVDSSLVVNKTANKDISKLITTDTILTLTFDESTMFDYGPCYREEHNTNDKYKRGHWIRFEFEDTIEDTKTIELFFNFKTEKKSELHIDCGDIDHNTLKLVCLAKDVISESKKVTYPLIKYRKTGTKYVIYFYVYVNDATNFEVDISAQFLSNWKPEITKSVYDSDLKFFDRAETMVFNVYRNGYNIYPTCYPHKLSKAIFFEVFLTSEEWILIYSNREGGYRFLQEVDEFNYSKCVGLWEPLKFKHQKTLRVGSIHGYVQKGTTRRLYAVFSDDKKEYINLKISKLCPDGCNSNTGNGYCSFLRQQCVCNDGFGGDNCIKKCYHNFTWQEGIDHSNLCYYGSEGCNSMCTCEEGYTLDNNLCVSAHCLNSEIDTTKECFRNSEGCSSSCKCIASKGYVFGKDGYCKVKTCGNGLKEMFVNDFGETISEECDSVNHCDELCRCENGYIGDMEGKCVINYSKNYEFIFGLTGSLAGLFLVCLSIIGMTLIIINNIQKGRKFSDLQTKEYYHYIQGSKKNSLLIEKKFTIHPNELDFGNDENATEIFETRFEKIEIRNYSKKKHMMVIFHVPQTPKYSIVFNKQVVFISALKKRTTITCFLTLNCSTKIYGTKIPYTVWFSYSSIALKSIQKLLEDKTFETWTKEDQDRFDTIESLIESRYNGSLEIQTSAVNSTHLDLDEIRMSEDVIAEGASGKIHLGMFKGIPVAVKKFNWKGLPEDEILRLKLSVLKECEVMNKLRNPFVVNYIGSVTYTEDIIIVSQYFTLGSLAQYINKTKKRNFSLCDITKMKMLLDTSRGMRFLHENKILHLDLKPDNLLVNSLFPDSACCIKITDFGTSRTIKCTRCTNNQEKGLGTPLYLAPESFKDVYSQSSDVFSFAVTAWEVFHEESPYEQMNSIFAIKSFVINGGRLEIDSERVTPALKTLITRCWSNEPDQRPGFHYIAQILSQETDVLLSDHATANNTDIETFVSQKNQLLSETLVYLEE
ncbi:serine-threonine protein kinase, putative [Entamoeba invadens IP1]|uniref:Serine-threonine protein kinase, putative n=1 Tax=Entamoeba invadens IP1 TaxID=370355 RepID=A0A0A1U2B5_ENTIV|nr:serine-threonine protein kinase, putative [Entamoeba invadens IP1]ELP85658.1 serine-threonine protein kinase, putative [Entamoeba invadens IP1]|eukprot:XP_004185004.1 serine-threonine protein kinase, putative [Entamoeba invadens IP1]